MDLLLMKKRTLFSKIQAVRAHESERVSWASQLSLQTLVLIKDAGTGQPGQTAADLHKHVFSADSQWKFYWLICNMNWSRTGLVVITINAIKLRKSLWSIFEIRSKLQFDLNPWLEVEILNIMYNSEIPYRGRNSKIQLPWTRNCVRNLNCACRTNRTF